MVHKMASEEWTKLTFWEHAMELLRHLRTIFFAVAICTVVVMVVPIDLELTGMWYPTIATTIIKQMQIDFLPIGTELLPVRWIAPLEVYLFTSVIIGFLISSPVIAFELHKFINPALQKHEKKEVFKFVVPFVLLFIAGSTLGYFLILPTMLITFSSFAGLLNLPPIYEFSDLYALIGMTLAVSGLIFTFPVFLIALIKAEIVSSIQITKNRKYVYGVIVILIAVIDPEPGIVTESVLFIPILILMEASLVIAKRIEKSRSTDSQ